MTAYHGTTVRGLEVLRPFASPHSNLDYPCVYLSADKALASIYIWKHPFKWMTFEIGEDGIPVYNESFKDGLRAFYGGGHLHLFRIVRDGQKHRDPVRGRVTGSGAGGSRRRGGRRL